jgi:hypothetical protein
MGEYFVVLNEGSETDNADFNFASEFKPTGTSKVLGSLQRARTVKLEAASVEDAQTAARMAYGANNTPIVVTSAQWKES